MSDAVEGQTEAGSSKGKLVKLLALGVIALVVLGGAGAGGFFYFQKVKATTAADGKEKEEKKEDKKEHDKEKAKHKEKSGDFVSVKNQDDEEEEGDGGEEEAHERPKSEKGDGEKTDSAGKPEKKRIRYSLPNDAEVSHVVDLQPIISNLADTDGVRYLRLGVSIGMKGEEGGKEHKPEPLLLARIRNAILTVLMNKTSEEVGSSSGKIQLRQELLRVVRAAARDKEIEAVYITEFLIQR
jgi:flagellar FliL protein